MTNYISRQIILSVLGAALILIAVFGVSYALEYSDLFGKKNNQIESPNLTLKFNGGSNCLTIDNKNVYNDFNGIKNSKYLDFSLKFNTKVDTNINYEISVEKQDLNNNLIDSDVKIYLEKFNGINYENTEITNIPKNYVITSNDLNPSNSMVLYSGVINSTDKNLFRLRLWCSNSNLQNSLKYYRLKVNAYAKVM